jgi:DNA-directed RNA polymerase alpha subunit
MASTMRITLDELDLSYRVINALRLQNVNTLDDLTKMSAADLRALPRLGRASIEEIGRALAARGATLKESS